MSSVTFVHLDSIHLICFTVKLWANSSLYLNSLKQSHWTERVKSCSFSSFNITFSFYTIPLCSLMNQFSFLPSLSSNCMVTVTSSACKMSRSNCLDCSVVNLFSLKRPVAFAIIPHFGMNLFRDAHVVMRSFPVWIYNIAKACFRETPEWLFFYLMPESLND